MEKGILFRCYDIEQSRIGNILQHIWSFIAILKHQHRACYHWLRSVHQLAFLLVLIIKNLP